MITTLTRQDKVGSGPFDSIRWALETHVGERDNGEYNFAILHGNEDNPEKIEFFRQENPRFDDSVDFTWETN